MVATVTHHAGLIANCHALFQWLGSLLPYYPYVPAKCTWLVISGSPRLGCLHLYCTATHCGCATCWQITVLNQLFFLVFWFFAYSNTNIVLQITKINNKKQSLHIFKILAMGCSNNNRIKWQITVVVLWPWILLTICIPHHKYCIRNHGNKIEPNVPSWQQKHLFRFF